ncbi:helix-turn-helix domain-containing protein, partial [Chromobacterium haemolyticum]|uniref:helix-turn-helix domain-containing protein n=1 Tax=Chromobacterium haemolyticum TaxID=394935 RepID=UPI0013B42D63
MRVSSDYLREAMEKMGETSNRKAGEKLGIHGNTIGQYLSGERIMDDFACIMVAKVLDIDGMIVIAAAQMEREKNQARKDVWEDLLKKMGALVVAWMTAGAMLAGSLSSDSTSANGMLTKQYVAIAQHDKCILCQ